MATGISFYILKNAPSIKARDLYACKLIAKAYDNGKKVYIQTIDEATAQSFDLLLWNFNDVAFIPHQICTKTTHHALVSIGYDCDNIFGDILINLTQEIPPAYRNFAQLLEIIPNDETLKFTARQRYKIYQQHGLVTETFYV